MSYHDESEYTHHTVFLTSRDILELIEGIRTHVMKQGLTDTEYLSRCIDAKILPSILVYHINKYNTDETCSYPISLKNSPTINIQYKDERDVKELKRAINQQFLNFENQCFETMDTCITQPKKAVDIYLHNAEWKFRFHPEPNYSKLDLITSYGDVCVYE